MNIPVRKKAKVVIRLGHRIRPIRRRRNRRIGTEGNRTAIAIRNIAAVAAVRKKVCASTSLSILFELREILGNTLVPVITDLTKI